MWRGVLHMCLVDVQLLCHRVPQFAYEEKRGRALYVVQAADDAKEAERGWLTPGMREELMRTTNPRYTKGLPGLLPLYIGMCLTLFSKDCVRFGMMKGCECIPGGYRLRRRGGLA